MSPLAHSTQAEEEGIKSVAYFSDPEVVSWPGTYEVVTIDGVEQPGRKVEWETDTEAEGNGRYVYSDEQAGPSA